MKALTTHFSWSLSSFFSHFFFHLFFFFLFLPSQISSLFCSWRCNTPKTISPPPCGLRTGVYIHLNLYRWMSFSILDLRNSTRRDINVYVYMHALAIVCISTWLSFFLYSAQIHTYTNSYTVRDICIHACILLCHRSIRYLSSVHSDWSTWTNS